MDDIVGYTVAACGRMEAPWAIVGHSAGGYLALAAAAELKRKPNAVVSFYGFGSLRWGLEPAYLQLPTADPEQGGVHFYHWTRQQGRWVHEVTGKHPIDDAEWFERYEPVLRPADAAPTLLLHGDADNDVPVGESRKMAAALASAGIDHVLVEVADGGHGFDGDVVYLGVVPDLHFQRVLEFLESRIRG